MGTKVSFSNPIYSRPPYRFGVLISFTQRRFWKTNMSKERISITVMSSPLHKLTENTIISFSSSDYLIRFSLFLLRAEYMINKKQLMSNQKIQNIISQQ